MANILTYLTEKRPFRSRRIDGARRQILFRRSTSPTMDNFLNEQKQGASDPSTGSFTLNRERALELAKTLQLPEKRAYVLKLVQWAVTSGASHIKVDTSKGRNPTSQSCDTARHSRLCH